MLETPDGPIFETAAILLWLSDRHGLGPAPTAPHRGAFLKWLFFLSNTAHADLRQLFYPGQYVPANATAGHHVLLSARMKRHFALLNQAALDQPALFAPPSVLTVYIAVLMRWAVLYPAGQTPWFHLADTPDLARHLAALDHMPAAGRVSIAEDLGTAPFSAPRLAPPP